MLARIFGNAFSTPGADELSAEEASRRELLFARIASAVVHRGLTVPAILFLEMHKPLEYVAGQLAHGLGPFASLVADRRDVEDLARALCRRDGIEGLIRAIEDEDEKIHGNHEPGEREV